MMSINFSDIAILNIKSADYRCIISKMSKNQTVNVMQNTDLIEKSTTCLKDVDIEKVLLSNKISCGQMK